MIETRYLKNVVIFIQTVLSFVLSRKILCQVTITKRIIKIPLQLMKTIAILNPILLTEILVTTIKL